jgi:hypothetical protein
VLGKSTQPHGFRAGGFLAIAMWQVRSRRSANARSHSPEPGIAMAAAGMKRSAPVAIIRPMLFELEAIMVLD